MAHGGGGGGGGGGAPPGGIAALDLIKAVTAYVDKMIMSKETAGMKALVLDKETVQFVQWGEGLRPAASGSHAPRRAATLPNVNAARNCQHGCVDDGHTEPRGVPD